MFKFLVLISLFLLPNASLNAQKSLEPAPDFFRTPRDIPVLNLPVSKEIKVADYGGVINDGKNDIEAISNAINAAKLSSSATNPVRVVFEKGTYDLLAANENSHSISVADAKYLELEGNGAEIMLHNPEVGFLSLLRCENVIIRNMFIDYAKLPFTQGKVVATDPSNSTFDLQIDEGFPLLSEAYFSDAPQKWGMLKEETGQLKKGVTNLFPYRGWTQLSGNLFRVNQPNASYINQIEVGDYFVQIARNNGKTIFLSNAGKNITYMNITSYASPAGTYNTFNHYEWNIINCKILPKAGRVQSANADCIHISGGYIGPWVEGCRFEAYSDDAVNMKYASRKILSIQNPMQITVQYSLSLSDSLYFYNPREGKFLGKAAVTSVKNLGSNQYQTTLSEPVNITVVGSHQSADHAYTSTQACESFVFRNDTMLNGRRYGMLLQNCYGIIENCLFENVSSCGIKIENGVDWGEGFVARNIKIANNKFVNCGFDKTFLEDEIAASISTRVTKLGSPCNESMQWCGVETADWMGLKDIEISGNYFEFNKAAVNLNNIDGGSINMSRFKHSTNDISIPPNGEYNAVTIKNCINFKNEDVVNSSMKRIKTDEVKFTIQNNILNIQLSDDHYEFQFLEVFDAVGRLIIKRHIISSDIQLNLSDMNHGMFIVNLRGTKGIISKKIIKTS